MKVFTVHEPPEGAASLDRIAFVKEGFCWPALFIPVIWILWHRLWWVLLIYLVVGVGLGAAGEWLPNWGIVVGTASLLFAVWFALEANGLRRWSLDRKGWRMVDVASGRDREEAERSFYARGAERRSRPRPVPAPGLRPAAPAKLAGEPVIGLFPQPE